MGKLINYIYWRIGRKLYHYEKLRNLMPDKMFLMQFFAQCMGYQMDFDNPKTFNEKLHWLKLYDRKSLYTTLVDKYAVKQWVSNIIGEEYIIPTLNVYNSVDDIKLECLPTKFVLKCTHDSGSVVVCNDKSKLSSNSLIPLRNGLKQNYYLLGREWPYKNVPPKIIAEQFVNDTSGDLKDYKFFCFNNKVKLFKVDFNRQKDHHANYYDRDGNLMPFGECVCPPDFDKVIELPANLSQMIYLAEKITSYINSPFVRVDFYDVDGHIYFGEITFFPSGGHGAFTLPEWDEQLGSWINISM